MIEITAEQMELLAKLGDKLLTLLMLWVVYKSVPVSAIKDILEATKQPVNDSPNKIDDTLQGIAEKLVLLAEQFASVFQKPAEAETPHNPAESRD